MQNEKKQYYSERPMLTYSAPDKVIDFLLFVATFSFVLFNLINWGSMINQSSDAADIWKTITTYYSETRYPSYVLYKGFASVYPYVWFYQLALSLNTNEFFFIMCYHAMLFGYVSVIGIPVFVKEITGYHPKIWQKILLVVTLYWYWSRYGVLTQLMVDLPSCAFFFLSVHFASRIVNSTGIKKVFCIISAGLLCGISSNISGQYSVAAVCVCVYASIKIWRSAKKAIGDTKKESCQQKLQLTALLILSMYFVSVLNAIFEIKVVNAFRENGVHIANADAWMHRALIYMIDIGRLFYGPQLYDGRGHGIILNYYGLEAGEQILQLASAGSFGWTIKEYFQVFFKYPLDFFILYMNRVIIAISDDCKQNALHALLASYTMVYLAILTAIKRVKKLKDVFNANFWLVFGALASMIPVLVMTVEMRYTLSFQGLYVGVALLGPTLPRFLVACKQSVSQRVEGKKWEGLLNGTFPWEIMCWIVFCLLCLGYFGGLVAGSVENTESILFKW